MTTLRCTIDYMLGKRIIGRLMGDEDLRWLGLSLIAGGGGWKKVLMGNFVGLRLWTEDQSLLVSSSLPVAFTDLMVARTAFMSVNYSLSLFLHIHHYLPIYI